MTEEMSSNLREKNFLVFIETQFGRLNSHLICVDRCA